MTFCIRFAEIGDLYDLAHKPVPFLPLHRTYLGNLFDSEAK